MSELFLVLGMHKSGTTLLSEILHHSGIEMIEHEDSRRYDEGNHYERNSTNSLNKQLLACGERSSLRVVDRLDRSSVDPKLEKETRDIVAKLAEGKKSRGFKDPRTCLTYHYWKEILPPHKLVCVYRPFDDVHAHYTRRVWLKPFNGIKALRAWHIYNECMLEAYESSAPDKRLIVDYSKLVQGSGEFDRLGAFIGRELVDRRVKNMHRTSGLPRRRLKTDVALSKLFFGNDVNLLSKVLSDTAERERQSV